MGLFLVVTIVVFRLLVPDCSMFYVFVVVSCVWFVLLLFLLLLFSVVFVPPRFPTLFRVVFVDCVALCGGPCV